MAQQFGQDPAQALDQIGFHPPPGGFANGRRRQLHRQDRRGARDRRPQGAAPAARSSTCVPCAACRLVSAPSVSGRSARFSPGVNLGLVPPAARWASMSAPVGARPQTMSPNGAASGSATRSGACNQTALIRVRSRALRKRAFRKPMPSSITATSGARVQITDHRHQVLPGRGIGHGGPAEPTFTTPEGGQTGQQVARDKGHGAHRMRPAGPGQRAFGRQKVAFVLAEAQARQRQRGVDGLGQRGDVPGCNSTNTPAHGRDRRCLRRPEGRPPKRGSRRAEVRR